MTAMDWVTVIVALAILTCGYALCLELATYVWFTPDELRTLRQLRQKDRDQFKE